MWIRSQDKDKMMKIQEVYLVKNNKQFRLYSDEVFLGSYQTEKRALEVLDEIHEYIENEYITNQTKKELINNFSKLGYEEFIKEMEKLKNVYQMPKE